MVLEYIIRELVDPRVREFKEGYSLICEAIPWSERGPKQQFVETLDAKKKGLLGEDNYHFITATTQNKVSGVATGYYISSLNMGFVNNIVIGKELRGKGLGAFLRNSLVSLFKEDSAKRNKTLDAVLGEVEEKNPWLGKLTKDLGAKVFGFSYVQPPVQESSPAKKLCLYIQPIGRSFDDMTKPQTIQIVREIYKNIYDMAKPETNHYYKKILDGIKSEKYIFAKGLRR